MKKHRFRDSLKSFFEPHFDPDKDELLKETKNEIDEKVKKLLGIVESGRIDEDESKKVTVEELVKELHREYESLYYQYDELTGEIKKKVNGKGDDESSSSSSSDSDSDHSSNKRNGRVEKNTEPVKKQLEAANLEIADLKKTLTRIVEEKEAADSEHIVQITNLRDEIVNKASALEERNSLSERINELQLELDSLQAKKNETEAELERERQEKPTLLNQINDVQKALLEQEAAYNTLSQEHKQVNDLFKEREATIKKLTDDYKQSREMLEEYMSKLEETERKMLETTSRESTIEDLEETVESLRNEVEMKGEEVESLREKMSNIEVKLRLSNQKLRVTEQVLREREEEFKKVEAKHLEEQALLEEKLAETHKTYQGMIKDITESMDSTLLDWFQTLSEKVEEKQRSYKETVAEATEMVLITTKWVMEMKKEKEVEKKEIEKKEEEVKKLEGEVREEEKEKEKLKERLLGLGEEKREAIRQLCVWTEHHRNRCEYLEEVLSKMTVARKQLRSQRA